MQRAADIDLTTKDIAGLASPDAVAAFLARLGYPTDRREELSAAALGLPPETADAIRKMELLADDDERFFRVIFVRLRSITAKARNELARNLGSRNADHLLILTKDFDVFEFVLIDKETRQRHAPGRGPSVRVIPRVVTVMRRASTHLDRRILRRLTWTGKDGLDQFDKLRSVFEAAPLQRPVLPEPGALRRPLSRNSPARGCRLARRPNHGVRRRPRPAQQRPRPLERQT